jgi:hypothetical protein
MENLGINYSELLLPTDAEIASIDPDVVDLYTEYHERRVSQLLSDISDERSVVLESRPATVSGHRTIATGGSGLVEEAQLQKIKQQQRREVEAIVQAVLRVEHQRVDAATKEARARQIRLETIQRRAAHTAVLQERHIQKVKEHEAAEAELERQRQARIEYEHEKERQRLITLERLAKAKNQRLREKEASRLQKTNRNREAIERAENERIQRLREKAEQDNQRQLALQMQRNAENEAREKRNREEEARKKAILEAIRNQEEEQWGKLKLDCLEHDIQKEAWLAKFRRKQAQNRERMREKEDEKAERYGVQKTRIEEEMYQAKVQSVLNDESQKDHLLAVQKEKERELKRRAFSLELKKDERDRCVAHIARQNELKKARARERLERGQAHADLLMSHKQRVAEERHEHLLALARQKEKMTLAFQEQVSSGKATPESIRNIAEKYGVDVNELERKLFPTRSSVD